MTLRSATSADLGALQTLEHAAFKPNEGLLSKRAFAYHIARGHVIVADNEETAGYLLYFLDRYNNMRLYSLCVDVRFRKRGIADALVVEMLKRAAVLACKSCYLEVGVANEGAITLYRRHGFETIKLIPDYYGEGLNAYKMQKLF